MTENTATPVTGDGSSSPDVLAVMNAVRILFRAIRLSNVEVERQLGISLAQLFVLEQLAERAAASVNELADRTQTHQSSVSVVVRRLVERGLVSKTPSATDARRMELLLTAAGRALLERAPRTLQSQLLDALSHLPGETVHALALGLDAWLRQASVLEQAPPMLYEDSEGDARLVD